MADEHNFAFPVTTLTGSDFYLEPFNTTTHTPAYYAATGASASLYNYMSIGPFPNQPALLDTFITPWTKRPTNQLYAIMTTRQPKINPPPTTTTTKEPAIAGVVGYCSASSENLKLEIGPIILVPQYQSIGLAHSVVSLMISHAMKAEAEGGWGVRRIQWLSHTENGASIRLAERLGFRREGVIRCDMVYPDGVQRGKVGNGRAMPPDAGKGDLARDSVVLAICWDDLV